MGAEFDRESWERRWSAALARAGHDADRRPPNAHLVGVAADLRPGLALDAGAGHGSEALWLAARGWRVTAVDFSTTALDHARGRAAALGREVAERVRWVEGDLARWAPPPGRYDLVACLHVHVAGSVAETVRRLGAGVAPGGTLLLVGRGPVDPATGAPTGAADQVQVSVDGATAALDEADWEMVVAEDRPAPAAGTGIDAVIRARRRS